MRRPSMVATLSVVVATALAASVARAEDLRNCAKTWNDDLPAADLQACGRDTSELWGYRYGTYMTEKCSNAACMRLYAIVDAANPNECLSDAASVIKLRSQVLVRVYAACAATTEPPSAPPTPVLTPAPAPAPAPPTPGPVRVATPGPSALPSPSSSTPSAPSTARTSTPSSSGSTTGDQQSPSTNTPPMPTTTAPKAEISPTPSAEGVLPPDDSTTSPQPTSPSTKIMTSQPSTPSPPQQTLLTATTKQSSTSIWIGLPVAIVVIAVFVMWLWWRRQREQVLKGEDGSSQDGSGTLDDSSTPYASSLDDGLLSARLRAKGIVDQQFLGKGGQGFVYLVSLPDGSLLASKRLASNQVTASQFSQLVAEVHIVATLKHRNIVRFAGVAWTSPLDFQVLFEFMEGGDLRKYLDTTKPSSCSEAWSLLKLEMAVALTEGLAYAHSFNPPLVHRDLKSRNILLKKDLRAKISDFGVSRYQSENNTMTTGIGTNRWLAPEVILGGGSYTERCDIYSFGVVLTELDTRAPAREGTCSVVKRDWAPAI